MSAPNKNTTVKDMNTTNMTDEELAKQAQEELALEGDMEEVRASCLFHSTLLWSLLVRFGHEGFNSIHTHHPRLWGGMHSTIGG
jgi:hypothetical protein